MTKAQRLAREAVSGAGNVRAVTKAIELAEARMQERCAKVAQDMGGHIAQAIADRIRALEAEELTRAPGEPTP